MHIGSVPQTTQHGPTTDWERAFELGRIEEMIPHLSVAPVTRPFTTDQDKMLIDGQVYEFLIPYKRVRFPYGDW